MAEGLELKPALAGWLAGKGLGLYLGAKARVHMVMTWSELAGCVLGIIKANERRAASPLMCQTVGGPRCLGWDTLQAGLSVLLETGGCAPCVCVCPCVCPSPPSDPEA